MTGSGNSDIFGQWVVMSFRLLRRVRGLEHRVIKKKQDTVPFRIIRPGVWPVTGWMNLRHRLDALWCVTRTNIRPIRFFFWFRYTKRFICRPGPSATLSPRQMTDFVHIHWPCDPWRTNNSKWYHWYSTVLFRQVDHVTNFRWKNSQNSPSVITSQGIWPEIIPDDAENLTGCCQKWPGSAQ